MISKIQLLITILFLNSAFSQGLSPDFHKNRREILRNKLPKNSVAVVFANPIKNRSNDVDYIFHQHPNFYYLTGLNETDAMLVIFSDDQKDEQGKSYNEILYVHDKDPQYALWNGDWLGSKNASEKLKIYTKSTTDFIENPIDFTKFDNIFIEVRNNLKKPLTTKILSLYNLIEKFKQNSGYDKLLSNSERKVYNILKNTPLQKTETIKKIATEAIQAYPELRKDSILNAFNNAQKMIDYAKIMKRLTKKLNHKTKINQNLNFILGEMREIKTNEELKLLKKAIDISVVGQIEMMKAMKPHISEREIQGVHEFVYKKYGASYEGYPSIVGAGNNGCVLHYIKNDKPHAENGELVLMDLGAEYKGYTADITRTIPTNGKFSKEQKAIYEIVLEAQTEGIKQAKVGNSFWAPGQIARKIINRGLFKLGIIEDVDASHNYFPHGTSHYLGLDVHDAGTFQSLRANSVITVEPGIYIPKGSPCDKKWWGIAIRIEDDILITDKGPVNLSEKAPRTIENIEKMMMQKSILKDFILPKLD